MQPAPSTASNVSKQTQPADEANKVQASSMAANVNNQQSTLRQVPTFGLLGQATGAAGTGANNSGSRFNDYRFDQIEDDEEY